MKVANQNRRITAVIAFSPGEYFIPLTVKDWLKDFDRMVYVSLTSREQPFVTELLKEVPTNLVTSYRQSGNGVHGASALWSDNPQANDIWMSLLLFVNKVKEERYKYLLYY